MHQIKILITGSKGQVGREFEKLQFKSVNFISLGRSDLDITNIDNLHIVVQKFKPDFIVNCAAYTAVDTAEKENELAFRINKLGPENLGIISSSYNIPIINISTDYVFDGSKDEEYKEGDITNPINIYGSTKLAGELALAAKTHMHINLRTSWVFGAVEGNFVSTMIKLRDHEELRIVADQWGAPTSAKGIAVACTKICIKLASERLFKFWGTYHFTGDDKTNWASFAKIIFDKVAENTGNFNIPNVVPIKSAEYPTVAKRPQNSKLSCNKITDHFGIAPDNWNKALDDIIPRLLA